MHAVFFVDCNKFIKAVSSFNHCLLFQQDIISVQAWCQIWKLPLNTSTCNALDNAKMQNAKIQFIKVQCDLGAIIKDDLSWSDNYNHGCSKACHSLSLIHITIMTNLSAIPTVSIAHRFGGHTCSGISLTLNIFKQINEIHSK